MSKRLLKISAAITGFLLLLFLTLLLLPEFFSGNIKSEMLRRLNGQITARIEADGPARISLLSHFPDASLSFSGILILSEGSDSDTVAFIDRLSFLFNPFDFLRGRYTIRKVDLGHARLMLHIDAQGRKNFEVLKMPGNASPRSGPAAGESLSLNISGFSFDRIDLDYRDERSSQYLDFSLMDGQVAVQLNNGLLDMNVNTDLRAEAPRFGGVSYPLPADIHLGGRLTADREKGIYRFVNTSLLLDGAPLRIRGLIEEKPYGFWIDLLVAGEEMDMGILASLCDSFLPEPWHWQGEGSWNLRASAKGPYGSGRNPHLDFGISLRDARVRLPFLEDEIRELDMELNFNNGTENSFSASELVLRKVRLSCGGYPLDMEGRLRNFDSPDLKLKINGTWDARTLSPEAIEADISGLGGLFIFENLQLHYASGRMAAAGGTLNVVDLAAESRGEAFEAGVLKIKLKDKDLEMNVEDARLGASDFSLRGKVKNWPAFPDSSAGHPSIEAEIHSDFQDWNELDRILGAFGSASASEDSTADYLKFLKSVRGDLNFSCGELRAGSFRAEDIVAGIRLRPYLLTLDTLSLKSSGGAFHMRSIGRYLPGGLLLESELRGSHIDVRALFRSFDNFRQDYLLSENLSGRMEGRISGSLEFDRHLRLQSRKSDLKGTLEIRDGGLYHFAPMMQLSSFVKVKELEEIHFSTLKNIVLLKGDRVILPVMAIQSTAMNLWLSGDYFYYPDSVDYYFKVDLLDVLARKFSPGKSSLPEDGEERDGLLYLYVAMKGGVDDPEIEFSKRKVTERFERMNLIRENEFIDFDQIGSEAGEPRLKPQKSSPGEMEFIEEW